MPLLTIQTTLLNRRKDEPGTPQFVSILLTVEGKVVSYENKLAADPEKTLD